MVAMDKKADRLDLEFMPDIHAASLENPPFSSHAILWVTLSCLVIAIVWANFAKIDQVAHAEGRVIPSSQIQIVQNLEGGILAEMLVEPGATVRAGQTLIRMDDTRFASSYNEGLLNSDAILARISRLRAEVNSEPFVPPEIFNRENRELIINEASLYESRQNELQSSIDILRQQLTQQTQSLAELQAEEQKLDLNSQLAEQELALTEPLVETGAVSKVELLRLQIAVNESVGRLKVIRLGIPRVEAVVREAEEKIEERKQQFISQARAELNEAETQISLLSISNVALEDRVKRTEVRSPVDGTVKQVLVNTVGSTIQPGMDLVAIVPTNDSLLVEARIRPADIAFIHPGQPATVKLTAYDFAIYGGLPAVLELISADSITDERGEHFFEIRVRTNENHLGSKSNPLPIMPGMVATVDIMTGKKTVMDYLLKPLKRAQEKALSEN
ncbi:MAG: adhesin transport system membrane fusion protein [Candidatus Azotimanducaceae bacterium]|jgi:adhesin transport system membrane fusion protein